MNNRFKSLIEIEVVEYKKNINKVWKSLNIDTIESLSADLFNAWLKRSCVFLCGNGGSAANANHLANDLIYGINPSGRGMNVNSLCANSAINLCLANDIGYEYVFSHQLRSLGKKGDLLLVFSGSGNSPNIVQAINEAKTLGITSYAMLGYDGGQCLQLVDKSIHFKANDMQISEDFQMIVGHIVAKHLRKIISEIK
jgi:D-sedoheptulose 7-phosphate isomerase